MDGVRQGLSAKLTEREWQTESPPPPGWSEPARAHAPRTPGRPLEALEEALRSQVIPRLLAAARRADPTSPADRAGVEVLVALSLAEDPDAAADWIEVARVHGATFESLCLDALAPAARRLGELWNDDRCDFAQVTLGTLRLTRALHALSAACPARLRVDAPRALFVPVPGEQHSFGATMLVAFFRRAGWDAESGTPAAPAEVGTAVRARRYQLAGISASRDDALGAVGQSVAAVRASSCNRSIAIFVGGRLFAERPELVATVGADRVTTDARQALLEAERLLSADARGAR